MGLRLPLVFDGFDNAIDGRRLAGTNLVGLGLAWRFWAFVMKKSSGLGDWRNWILAVGRGHVGGVP
jgi:hypothetical protein